MVTVTAVAFLLPRNSPEFGGIWGSNFGKDLAKRQAEEIFNDLGMTLSGAISVQYQGIPFSVRRRSPVDRCMEAIMDETDEYCRTHSERLSHDEVFSHAREMIHAGRRH